MPLPEPTLTYSQLDPQAHISVTKFLNILQNNYSTSDFLKIIFQNSSLCWKKWADYIVPLYWYHAQDKHINFNFSEVDIAYMLHATN